MAKVGMYVIFDSVADECGPVFMAPNHGVARRAYVNAMKDVPEVDKDVFCLYRLGTLDTESMEISEVEKREITWKQEELEFITAEVVHG